MLIIQVNQVNQKSVIFLAVDKVFKFQSDAWNRCHDVLIMSLNLSNIAVLKIHSIDYDCSIARISKSDAINLIQNIDLSKKWNIMKHKKLLSHIKKGEEIITFRDIETEKHKFYRDKSHRRWKDVDLF